MALLLLLHQELCDYMFLQYGTLVKPYAPVLLLLRVEDTFCRSKISETPSLREGMCHVDLVDGG